MSLSEHQLLLAEQMGKMLRMEEEIKLLKDQLLIAEAVLYLIDSNWSPDACSDAGKALKIIQDMRANFRKFR